MEFEGGDERNLKIQIRIPVDSENSISEGSVFNIPPGPGETCARITLITPPGASPTCFKDIFYNLQTREEGSRGERLARELLAQNICIVETLEGHFTSHRYDKADNQVVSYIQITNSAGIEQKTKFRMVEPCSFSPAETAEQQILSSTGTQRIFPDQPQVIPANRQVVEYVVFSTLPAGKEPTFPLDCTVKLDRVLEK